MHTKQQSTLTKYGHILFPPVPFIRVVKYYVHTHKIQLSLSLSLLVESHCSQVEDYPLNFDLFMELLSNHSTIARGLKRAPLFGDMNPDSPAWASSVHRCLAT